MNRHILIALATSSLLTLAIVSVGSCKKDSHSHADGDATANGGSR